MKQKRSGYILLVLFLLVSSSLIVGTVILYQAVKCYHVAQYQYQYYQRKYLLEGLLNHTVNNVVLSFDSYYQQNETVEKFVRWGNINGIDYDGQIKTHVIESNEEQRIGIIAEIKHDTDEGIASCILVKEGKVFYIDKWRCR
ncbi:TPA: hypothetical protein DIC20_04335 [Candidatus Dependentiae bacterium]|nr:MAG: hypothetical protein US03_C0004G0034 [candidate division TM6 bacterium GW2011_GWF2_36_131]KKQ03212.1 MAG: hypothetical protein US13_C0004G0034 [candidate division TM6 bacterium GW2011_GWE2_36_25]KKQ19002.1 MAG: hypothetical protein US32_C0018G0008 [candidate division TM6 bacterium GW2011_GWA2_36_9]HBR70358.1 hypothetical protein [Candidatus Dependentiae bacterium]HCU00903.1 hypothetical protein [Candidatus Dependentiae bacterium]